VLTNLDPASALAIGLLIFSLLLVIAFEATNGFHDAANAVATVIYTKSLTPGRGTVWSGLMNFIGVSAASALLMRWWSFCRLRFFSPPSGAPTVSMLVSLVRRGVVLEHRNMVAWPAELELALPAVRS